MIKPEAGEEISALKKRIRELEQSESDLKRAEERLRESEARFRNEQIFSQLLLDTSPAFIVAIDFNGKALMMNQALLDAIEYTKEEIAGADYLATFVPEEDRQDLTRVFQQIINEGKATVNENRIRNKSGQTYLVEWHSRTVHKEGDVGFFVEVGIDITKRKQAEEAITREREKLKTLSDNAPFGMVLIDQEDHFTYINRKFSELFGYNLSDIPDGRTWCRKAYPDAKYRHTVISAWRGDLGDTTPGEKKPNVFTVTCKDGTQKIIQFIFSVLVSGDSLMTCEDITELKHIESQLRQAHKMESIGTLAGGIAHDFNNILTALMGYASLIEIKMDRSDPLRAYVDEVLSASEKAVGTRQRFLRCTAIGSES